MKKTIMFLLLIGMGGLLGMFYTVTVQARHNASLDQFLEGEFPEMTKRKRIVRYLRHVDQLMLETGH